MDCRWRLTNKACSGSVLSSSRSAANSMVRMRNLVVFLLLQSCDLEGSNASRMGFQENRTRGVACGEKPMTGQEDDDNSC